MEMLRRKKAKIEMENTNGNSMGLAEVVKGSGIEVESIIRGFHGHSLAN